MTTTPDFRALCAEIIELWDADCDIDEEINEMRELLATPPPKPPTDKELGALADEKLWPIASEEYLDDYDRTCAIDFARAVLEMWGR